MKVLKVEWLLTRRCNLKCSYCRIRDPKSLRGEELTYEQVIAGVDIVRRLFPRVPIIFFGGEPTVLDYLPDLVKYCEDNDVKYAVISNGVRVMKDEKYFQRLVDAGISNWSVSIDSLSDLAEGDSQVKSNTGFQSLLKFREVGVRDLVSCITVTNRNIREVPSIIEKLSKNGVWGITTPLQMGDMTFEYSGFDKDLQVVSQLEVYEVSQELFHMARSGRYLMHNAPEYYQYWTKYFIRQDWKCTNKSCLTVDADGTLKRCVDRKAGLERFSLFDLDDRMAEYELALQEDFDCKGCFWDPAFETALRAETWDDKAAVDSFRHELTPTQRATLMPEVRKWFGTENKE